MSAYVSECQCKGLALGCLVITRRRGKNENDDDKRELACCEGGQEYAQGTKSWEMAAWRLCASTVKAIGAHPRNVKVYGELPENAEINENGTFGEGEGECTFEFGGDGEVDIDDI
ncbi:nucleic acid-binding protein [Lactarius vividus]|nr:nucleic acid-binding protein [Lactarius vividus]